MNQEAKEAEKHKAEEGLDQKKSKPTKKIKATVYLTEEAEQAFAELYAKRYVEDRKTDKSKIACEAILDLYEKENS